MIFAFQYKIYSHKFNAWQLWEKESEASVHWGEMSYPHVLGPYWSPTDCHKLSKQELFQMNPTLG